MMDSFLRTSKRLSLFLIPFLCFLAVGCGGGGSGKPTVRSTTTVRISMRWPERSRVVQATSSALSAVFTLTGAKLNGGDFVAVVSRGLSKDAYDEEITTTTEALVGKWNLEVRFCAEPDGKGVTVARAQTTITLAQNGTGIPTLAPASNIAQVEVLPDQTIRVGEERELSFVARDASGAIVALTSGSVFFTVATGADHLQITQLGNGKGLSPGDAWVTATVDGITGPQQRVQILSNAAVILSPTAATVLAMETQQFTATVTNATNSTVIWSVQEGTAGGTITAGGLYTAPSVAGTYHVVATSQFDTGKSAEAIVTVTLPDGIVYNPSNGHYYQRVDNIGVRWADAKGEAESRSYLGLPGHLVTVNSQAEQQFIVDIFGDPIHDHWIGAYQDRDAFDYAEPSAGWQWVTDEPWQYTNWDGITSEPNNDGGAEDWAAFRSHGRWNDLPEGTEVPRGYVVEYEPVPIAWNIRKDFSLDANPNGPWQYGYNNSLSGIFHLFEHKGTDSARDYWATNLDPLFYFAASRVHPDTTLNDGKAIPTIVPPNTFFMHPSSNEWFAETRWSAPAAGKYTLRAVFTGYSATSSEVFIFVKGQQIYTGRVNGYLSRISLPTTAPYTLVSGDTVRILVGTGGNGWDYDSTGVELIIAKAE